MSFRAKLCVHHPRCCAACPALGRAALVAGCRPFCFTVNVLNRHSATCQCVNMSFCGVSFCNMSFCNMSFCIMSFGHVSLCNYVIWQHVVLYYVTLHFTFHTLYVSRYRWTFSLLIFDRHIIPYNFFLAQTYEYDNATYPDGKRVMPTIIPEKV